MASQVCYGDDEDDDDDDNDDDDDDDDDDVCIRVMYVCVKVCMYVYV